MRPITAWLAAAIALANPSAAVAGGAAGFTLVNDSGAALTSLDIRRSPNGAWAPLVPAISIGARFKSNFADPDCAFDIRASGPAAKVWAGVNLCGADTVRLKLDPSGTPWVDYD